MEVYLSLRQIEFYRLFHKLRDFRNSSQVKILIPFYIFVRHFVAYSSQNIIIDMPKSCFYKQIFLPQDHGSWIYILSSLIFLWRLFAPRIISLNLLYQGLYPFYRAFSLFLTWYNRARRYGEASILQRMEA
jgi:hypothetical protein